MKVVVIDFLLVSPLKKILDYELYIVQPYVTISTRVEGNFVVIKGIVLVVIVDVSIFIVVVIEILIDIDNCVTALIIKQGIGLVKLI